MVQPLVSPTRELTQASYPHPSEGRETENHNHRKLTKLIIWITVLYNLMKLWAMLCKGHPRWLGHGDFWQNVVHWRREWQTTSAFLTWEPHEQYEKAKIYDTERWTLRSVDVLYATGAQQSLSQSRNDDQLCMCLVVKVKSDALF